MNELKVKGKPFVKWVGGKGQLLPQFEAKLPKELNETEFIYIEPFVGGGAMLFFMLQKFSNIKKTIINDINKNLTDAYQCVKDNPEELVTLLRDIETEYLSVSTEEARKDFYLQMRDKFNELNNTPLEKTKLLIFLNRTCFNGLYRENSKGKFNVPFGRYANPTICNEELIYADSDILNRFDVEIMNGDFSETIQNIDNFESYFFYFDPPYRPLNTTSSFNSYVKEAFDDYEQKRLAKYCHFLSEINNCRWMLSNADCSAKNPNDTFFEELYQPFNIQRVYASRSVNAVASKRGKLSELLISNFRTNDSQWLSAEELINLPEYKKDFLFEFGEASDNIFSTIKYKKDIAKTNNYKEGVFYHADGGTGEAGVGEGLYLGKDMQALFNFYNGEGEFGEYVCEYIGHPIFIDLSTHEQYEDFEREAIQLFGKLERNNHLKKLAINKGFDGIRYFDLYTTGEEFVLFNTQKVKRVKIITNEELYLRKND